jgi:hypothetical protein
MIELQRGDTITIEIQYVICRTFGPLFNYSYLAYGLGYQSDGTLLLRSDRKGEQGPVIVSVLARRFAGYRFAERVR